MVGTAIGPYLFGLLFDWTKSYQIAIMISIVLILVTCALLAMLPKFPDFTAGVEKTDPEVEFGPVPHGLSLDLPPRSGPPLRGG